MWTDDLQTQFDRLAPRLYLALRSDGDVDPGAAFDLAAVLMQAGESDSAVEELARAALGGSDREQLAALSRQVLSSHFDPGFDVEPGRFAVLEEALDVVRADLRAADLPEAARLVIPAWSSNAFVEYQGEYGSTGGISAGSAGRPREALLIVADETQDAVMEKVWRVWPVCPAHQFGAHPRDDEGTAVWWCTGGGHVVSPIGQWR